MSQVSKESASQIAVNFLKKRRARIRVYIDSGADTPLFTKTDAKLLGLNLYQGEYRPIIGIGKTLIPAYTHKVKMKIEETTLNVNTSFADSDEVPRLLGRTDIFKHFKITFNEQNLETIFETTNNLKRKTSKPHSHRLKKSINKFVNKFLYS
jgi:hypothetical protein